MGDMQERLSVSSSSSSSSSSTIPPKVESWSIDEESWMIAEERAYEILSTIQPLVVSDRSRNEIIDYLRTLIKCHDGIEVCPFGSVPLKTYLPDGDIDLTVTTKQNMDDDFYGQLCDRLRSEEKESEFYATDVQFIPAQVKVIKCNIKNIAVDISFNQMAGICSLCFLEQVDQIFGRDHIFKRSIILIKAWCYYESRILGANTGLISTYALAVLVLYIINLSHSSLSGPLAVLYKFLDYYGSFDWSNYCISVNGPVPISSLPELTATQENGHVLLLDETFFRECLQLYSFSRKVVEANGLELPVKHLNILDPLKLSNNLGKSVTKGNFQRIKHAFTLGARKLRDVLSLPGETMGWRLEKFFGNTLERNGKGERQDVNDPVTAFGTGRSELSELSGDFEGYLRRLGYRKTYHVHGYGYTAVSSQDSDLNVSNSMQQPFPLYPLTNGCQNMGKMRGTGTYIPDMSQQLYSDRFRDSSNHSLEASVEVIDDEGGSSTGDINEEEASCCNLDQAVLKSPRSGNLEIDEFLVENDKEEKSKSSQNLNGF